MHFALCRAEAGWGFAARTWAWTALKSRCGIPDRGSQRATCREFFRPDSVRVREVAGLGWPFATRSWSSMEARLERKAVQDTARHSVCACRGRWPSEARPDCG